MKGLLQSKRFRKNLKKWLCMYVGTLLLFTTVVTYSKYISSFGGSDKARVTKFNVVINNEACEGDIDNLVCNTDKYRPTSEIPYDFSINTEVEVDTKIVLSINVDHDFTLLKVEEIVGNSSNLLYSKDDDTLSVNGYTVAKDRIADGNLKLIRNVEAPINDMRLYRVTVKYNYNEKTYSKDKINNLRVVTIDYSATQVNN